MTDRPESHLDPRLLDGLDPSALAASENREALEHLAGCAVCRARVASSDPTRLLSLLALAPIPEDALDRLSANVEAAIDEMPSRRRRLRSVAVAALAASFLLAVMFTGYLLEQWSGDVPIPLPVVATPTDLPNEEIVGEFQVLASPGERPRVVDLAVGEAQVVMIFDEGLDI